MSNYDWIKVGVKAEIFGCVNDTSVNGEIITVRCDPRLAFDPRAKEGYMCVIQWPDDVNKGVDVKNLKPFNPPNWEGMADENAEKCPDFRKVSAEAVIDYLETIDEPR